jgi:hypothetical protein
MIARPRRETALKRVVEVLLDYFVAGGKRNINGDKRR